MEVPTKAEFQALAERLEALEADNRVLWGLQEKWVKPNRAAEVTGVTRLTLNRESKRPGTLLRYNPEDRTYELKSLLAYKRAKERKKVDPFNLRRQLQAAS